MYELLTLTKYLFTQETIVSSLLFLVFFAMLDDPAEFVSRATGVDFPRLARASSS